MAEPFLKSLECSCIKGTSSTCPGGGELSALITLNEASLFASLENDAKIVSPGEKQLHGIYIHNDNDIEITGDGPYFIVKINWDQSQNRTGSPFSELDISDGWELEVIGNDSSTSYLVKNIIDNDRILVYGVSLLIKSWRSQEYIKLEGFGNPHPPNATIAKVFGNGNIPLIGEGEISRALSLAFAIPDVSFTSEGAIETNLIADYSVLQKVIGECDFENIITDKIAGEFGNFNCQAKLYPSGDLQIDDGFGAFIGSFGATENLWSYIDEGVYEGVMKDGGDSNLLSDDVNSFIEPDTIHTEGLFQYKCELTEFNVRPQESAFRIRVAAPISNYESKLPPLYTIYNIRLSDPSGNLIVKYKDIQLRGDSDDNHPLNYATYSSLPEINVVSKKHDWERTEFPHLEDINGYQLSFSVRAVSLDDPFDPGFDIGFEENYIIPETFYASGNNYLALDGQPLSTQENKFINPTRGFRISAIEICNSGGYGPRVENILPFRMEVREVGRRLERCLTPTFMPLNNYDTTIYPSVTNNTWVDDTNIVTQLSMGITNEDICGAQTLVNILATKNDDRFITLQTIDGGGVADSGKLILKFQTGYNRVDEITPGDFNFSFDQNTRSIWWKPSGAFNTEKRNPEIQEDIAFYNVDSITLKVLAKKDIGSRDYVLDVVGYSDDKLLSSTSPSGGFIQDPSGIWLNNTFIQGTGNYPILSGFYGDNSNWTIGGASLSEHEDYYEASGNDHFKLTTYPIVTGTEFSLYEIPLVILDDDVRFGISRDYSLSSLLEHLYLDIYPLPSGASIAYAELCVRYAPANAFNLYSQGGERLGKTQDGRSEASIFPSGMESYDDILNAGSGYQPISYIEGLPHAYGSPRTIKSNYSRRWRGIEGTVRGPFDIDMFSLGFENQTIDYPFLSGYYKFDNIVTRYVKSIDMGPASPSGLGTASGLSATELRTYQNIGWRFASGTLFNDHFPGYSGNYTTTDWTSLSNGSITFVGDPMYGKIADAFDTVARISGEVGAEHINFGNIDTASGFAVFVRFTPDSNVSGINYNLFDSGVIFAKWDTADQMDFALGYKNGYLCGYAQDNLNNIIEVIDTIKYSGYQFPLNVILTYNDNESKKLKLYTDNEFISNFDVLRASSDEFDKNITDADIVLGYAAGSGVGMNMFVSDFGISAYSSGVDTIYGSGTNIVENNADKTYKAVTAETFLENTRIKYFDPEESYLNDRYKLWDRVNENIYEDWNIGDFKYCFFSAAFDQLRKRSNTEHIVFNIKHHGSGYSQNNDLPLLSNVDSGVAYHTQMENDFLRFHLSDVPNNFYSVNRRITKNLPIGYKFSEKALVVETVVEHKMGEGISWSTCEDAAILGPRMIVSLYTKKQEPYWVTQEDNWGLVNRKIHYIEPSSCLVKLESTFDYNDLLDETEAWSIFPVEPRFRDFQERYFKDDVNQMFVQYDLVYPSGPSFESRLELHSSHVRMADANILAIDVSENMNMNVSGGFPVSSHLDLNIGGFPRDTSGILPITIQVPFPHDVFSESGHSLGFTLNVSGAFEIHNSLNLFMPPQSGFSYFNLNISGELPDILSSNLSLAMPNIVGYLDTSDDGNPATTANLVGNFFGMPLVVHNADFGQSPDGPVLNLNMFASSGSIGMLSVLPTILFNNAKNTSQTSTNASVNLNLVGRNNTISRRLSKTMPLYINAPNIIDTNMNLYLHNPLIESLMTGAVNLVTASYNSSFGSSIGLWNNTNYGVGIDIEDDHVASLLVNNEIRGVDLIAYGSCTGNSPSKATDKSLVTDCTIWRAETCNDGGIFRAKETYTNSGAVNFEGGIGYSGNYYGIRKYDQLLPASPYQTTLVIKTGSTEAIPVPRTFEEWEYGMCGPAWYENGSGCCTEDCDVNIVFSGVKLIGDDACGVPPSGNLCLDSEFIKASGRNKGDIYGRSVKVDGNLMAIAAPNITIPDIDITNNSQIDVSGAGSIFLYRRKTDEPGKKAEWQLLEQLMLPSGFRKDYVQRSVQNLLTFGNYSISGQKWQIGQEGRQFGESLDICSSGNREVIVVGAPRAKWSREFDDITVSGIPTAGIVFADLFNYDKSKLQGVAAVAEKFNKLWKYFSAPWNPGVDEWYAEIKPKLIVLQLTYANRNYPIVPTDESSWFVHRYIPRLDDLDLLFTVGSGALGGSGSYADFIASGRPIVFNEMFSGVKSAFFSAFPSGSVEYNLHSGIPAIIGMFKEQTGSTAGALQYANEAGSVINIYDEFEKFYLAHSFASGVTDYVQQIKQSGHINTIIGRSEEWDVTSKLLLTDTFDSGRLASTFTNSTLNRNFVTSGVGQIWGDTHSLSVAGFQVPPASGGRVYVFENERGNFNCIQVIYSPNDQSEFSDVSEDIFGAGYGKTFNDRFGHSVSISSNGEVLAIGSPWLDKPCKILERDDSEIQKVYNRVREWCVANNKTDAINHYDNILAQSGISLAKISTFDFLQNSDRFAYRNDINFWGTLPTPYVVTFEYGYNDIKYIGTRKFLVDEFAPTSRLGWSCSVDEDGEIVAFGAPTDSLNEFEDVNVWGDSILSWASYHNAGAVRMFHNRKYYPHNEVVEFGRFGNLDRSTHPEERALGYYDQSNWPLIFGSGSDGSINYQGKPWRRTEFSEIEIPREAGLAFIITPELDAASDEIIDNIKNWLALGDRNLVLVGNDPVWEENGLYAESNDIINKILEKLGSRMRIHAARDITYSMQDCVSQQDLNDNKYNAVASYFPAKSTPRSIEYNGKYYVKGVGDIRIDLSRDNLSEYFEALTCPEGATCGNDDPPIVNYKCEFPLLGINGDLRAEWIEQCIKTVGNNCNVVTYRKNWPLMFSTYSVDCDEPPQPIFLKPNQEPVPVLTTAEHLPPVYWYNEATSGMICNYYQPYKYKIFNEFEERVYLASDNIDELAFNLEENGDSVIGGLFDNFYYNGDMHDPDAKNGRDGILQAIGTPFTSARDVTETIYPDHILALVESGRKQDGSFNNSRIYILASQWSEDDASRGITAATLNDDKNTEFYINMISKNCSEAPKGIQINGFTGRASLADAYNDPTATHSLANKLNVEFVQNGGFFRENKEMRDLNDQIDFVWLAFPSGKPSNNDLIYLNNWLDLGNKKAIITYNATYLDQVQETATNIDYLCSGLRLTSRPMFLSRIGEYYVSPIIDRYRNDDNTQVVNYATDSISGCNDGYEFTFPNYQYSTSLSGIDFNPSTGGGGFRFDQNQGYYDKEQIVPLSGGRDFERIISFSQEITETYKVYTQKNNWTIDGGASVTFPIEPGSGYRVWINWVSETPYEKFSICVNSSGNINIDKEYEDDFDLGGGGCGEIVELTKTTTFIPQQHVFDFYTKAEDNVSEFGLVFTTDKWSQFISVNELDGISLPPSTPRILSISGALLPVTIEVTPVTTSGLVPDGPPISTNCIYAVNPATSGFIAGVSRPVMHESSLYCNDNIFTDSNCIAARNSWKDELIQDGPVIVAEEFESFSPFANGNRRSKIILISDSTLLQGQCQHYRESTISGNQSFIRNLYPQSPDVTDEDSSFGLSGGVSHSIGRFQLGNSSAIRVGKNWQFTQKIRAPERGTPAKYAAVSGSSIGGALIPSNLWGGNGVAGGLSNYSDNEDSYNPSILSRPEEIKELQKIKERKQSFFQNDALGRHGMYPRFSGDFLDITNYRGGIYTDYDSLLDLNDEESNRNYIVDGNIGGGITELMKIEGTDYLDYFLFNSGCPGDLFGYSIDISNGKLIVGSPYNAFRIETAISGVSGIVAWHEIINGESGSGIDIGADGGAGAVFIFENTGSGRNVVSELLPWEFSQKIKSSNANVGIYDFTPNPIQALTDNRGPHSLNDSNFILDLARRGDRFGFSVAIDCDMVAIGAPNHDFETLHHHIYSGTVAYNGSGLSTAFQRKSFNSEYDIPSHSFYDLSDSGVRVDQFNNTSGLMILNGGAVYNYRNEMIDFQNRKQQWIFAEKLFAAGYKSRIQTELSGPIVITSGSDNDGFGVSVSIDRAKRGDSDYTLVVGSPYHDWPTSGNHPTSGLNNAGAAYTFDAMLREQTPAIPSNSGWIDAHVFGQKKEPGSLERLELRVNQNISGGSIEYIVSGIIFSNQNGDIFLEVSGFDPSTKGFITHRPYVDRVELKLFPGVEINEGLNLVTSGDISLLYDDMNLTLLGADSANVYNTLGLYYFGVSGLASGEMPSGLSLFTSAPSGPLPSSLNLVLGSTQTTNILNLRIRGY